MISLKRLVFTAVLFMTFEVPPTAMAENGGSGDNGPSAATTIPIINHWNGEYPVARLDRLPEGQQNTPTGCINDPAIFRAVWKAFMPKDMPPELDFDNNMVIFAGNVTFFNRTRILKVVLSEGIVDIVAMETRSALPIEDQVAMAPAEIPKKGVRAVRTNNHLFEGWVTVGHEVRAFRPCGQKEELWITGDSTGYDDIIDAHRSHAADREPYFPVFMVLYGQPVEAPRDGFGADYPGGFFASRLVRVPTHGNCKAGMIVVDSPVPGSTIVSPLTVTGRARGTWFFEGDFPMAIIDAGGNVIGQSYCTARDSWMTEKFVAFEGKITFERPASNRKAVLLLKKDNPTGKPEYDDAIEIPVIIH